MTYMKNGVITESQSICTFVNVSRKVSILVIVCIFFMSCSNKKEEISKEMAGYLIAKKYGLKSDTSIHAGSSNNKEIKTCLRIQIAIDRFYEDYGAQPGKYKKLEQLGLITLNPLPKNGKGSRIIEAILTNKGKKCLEGKRDFWTQTRGDIEQYVFYGYKVRMTNFIVSSNANEKTAKAEVRFKLYEPSEIQQIFNPVNEAEIKRMVNFKLFDIGWMFVNDEPSKLGIEKIDNPQHLAGN